MTYPHTRLTEDGYVTDTYVGRFAHLTDSEYRAVQCQVLAAEYAARAHTLRDTRWFADAADAAEWSAHYAASARRLMNVEVQ